VISSMSKLNIEDIYQLSPGQQGMLTVVLLAGSGSEVYFDQTAMTLYGELDAAFWHRAWQQVMDRHPALRTLFVWERKGEPLQVVRSQVELPWQDLDWSGLALAEREARLEDFLRADRTRGFDLGTPPLMRFALIRWEEAAWKLVWSFHHLIVDGWSVSRIFSEAVAAYSAFRDGREPDLETPRRYRDYIGWLQRQDLDRAKAFWRGALAGFDEPTPLPYDGTGRGGDGSVSSREIDWIPPAEVEALSTLARRNQLTLNTVFQGAWGALLARTAGRDDVIFGSVVSGRPGEVEGIESMVGFFINVLPVRVRVGNEAVGPALAHLQAGQVEQRDFEYCPLESIQAWMGLPRGSRLMESLLAFQNFPLDPLELTASPGFRIQMNQGLGVSHYPVVLYVAPRAGGLNLSLHYHESRLDAGSARQLLNHLRTLLAAFATRPEAGMAELPLITAGERLHLLAMAAGPPAPPACVCIHTLVEEQAARTPDAAAVEAGGRALTYRELNERAEILARRLRRLGVGPESIVGFCVERSPEMVVGMLGVLKAGGTYLPLDPVYPRERLAFMLEDSGARVLLTREGLAGSLPVAGREVVLFDAEDSAKGDEPETVQPVSGNGAYVIYTSGSTGRPKGVLIPHASLVGYVRSAGEDAGIGAGDRVLQFASMSFDTSAEEIYPCLARGATLVLRDAAMAGPPGSFLREVERLEITVLDLPTAYWHELVAGMAAEDLRWPACVRLAILGGEQAQGARLDVWRQRVGERCRLLNTYGPTEASIVTTRRDLNGPCDFPAEVPIGRPVPGARVQVVSRGLELLPAGLEGELVIGGAGLARGYLGRPDLTAERFVPDPFADSPGERLYRTGDLARWLRTGELEFRGRTDHQVKVRGFRIELGEIEAALRRLAGVREAAVVVREEAPGERRIVAYIVPAVPAGEPGASIVELRAGLRELLPDYMLPSSFVPLEALPLTPSGKIDRRALPAPSAARADLDAGAGQPRHPMEELLAGIWSDLLGANVAPRDSFFDIGGHSLLATRMISRVRAVLGVDLPMRAIFEHPTLAGFAAQVEQARQGDAGPELPPLVRVPRGGPLPASFSQQRLWFLARLEPDSFAYNLAWAMRLAGSLDVVSMARALTEIVCRHESLRTTFGEEAGQPLQVIAEPAALPLPVVDLAGLPAAEREKEAHRLATAEARRPYDLALGPLVRAVLLRLGEQEHALLAGMHHVISDGWSMGIFVRELAACYRAFAAGEPAALPELAIQYADFAVWQRQWLSGAVLAEWLAWWTGQLGGAPQVVELPLDRPRPAVQSYHGRQADLAIDGDLKQRLETMARRLGATPFMILLAGFATLLSRYGDQSDVVVGTPIANRGRPELEDLIGFFANTLALRVDLSGDPGFGELVRRVREMALGAYAHQDVPFERLVDELRPERSLSHSPVFQVALILQNLPASRLDLPGMTMAPLEADTGRAQFDLSLFFYPRLDGGLLARLEYASDLFDAATIQRLLGYFRRLLAGAVAEGGERARLSELPLMGAEEREQVLRQWNATATAYPREATIPGLFEEQARRTPDALAVVSGGEQLTYAELSRRAGRLAARLRSLGVRRGDLTGLCVERSLAMVVGMAGILKAGAAYVPLDTSYPDERLSLMLEDLRQAQGRLPVVVAAGTVPAVVLASGLPVADLLAGGEEEGEAAVPAPAGTADDLAYVIYTSGSTGRPKGVAVPQRAVARLVLNTDYVDLGPGDRIAQASNTAFDAATFEVWGALLNGGCAVVIPREELLAPAAFAQALRREGITTLFLTTALFNQMAREAPGAFGTLRHVLFGGEAVDPRWVAEVLGHQPPARLLHVYGPTESTTFASWELVREVPPGAVTVPIGKPIANTRAHLLDRYLEPVPAGVHGELYIGGDGLAHGYLNRPELTAERFVPDPFGALNGEPGGRLYRTGDLVRYLADGRIEFLGRNDFQVKIRGFRIELGEVEAALAEHPAVAAVVVLAREDEPGERRLVAYVVAAPERSPELAGLRRWLEERLPSYMVPAVFVALSELPLGPTGKVDRRALPAPAVERREAERPGERSPVEELLAGIWADLLGVPDVAPQESFFELGGHSLLATRMISRVRAVLGVELPIRAVFEEPTLAGFAAWVTRASAAEMPPLLAVPRHGLLPASSSQQRLWFLDRLEPGSFAYNLTSGVRLAGVLDIAALAAALSEVVRRHESLRTRFVEEEGEPWQVIAEPAPVPLPLFDLTSLPDAMREEEVRRIAAGAVRRPYDLARGPLVRCALLRLGDREHALLAGMHHIVSDGWSMGIFVRELGELYRALATGEPANLPVLPIQYADFAVWQRKWLSGTVLAELLAWWTGQLTGAPQVVELPLDRPRPAVQSYRGSHADLRLENELKESLERLTRRLGVTPFMALLSGYATLLCRYSGQSDVVVGTPIANRGHAEVEDLIGFFANTLALRVDLSGDPGFDALARRVREVALGAYAHQDFPFERLVNELRPERSLSHSPVFQVMLGLQNLPESGLDLAGLALSPLKLEAGSTQFDLSLFVHPLLTGGMLARLYYARDLFDAATAERLLGHLQTLLQGAVDGPEIPISKLPLLTPGERAQLSAWEEETSHRGGHEGLLHGLFEAQARRTPEAVALVAGMDVLSYAELAARSARLAERLCALGLGPEMGVAVCLERTADLVVALLAVLRAGAFYVPLDPRYPAERLRFLVEDSGARIVVMHSSLADRLPPQMNFLLLDGPETAAPISSHSSMANATAQNLAYLIYTSGSTGRPKAVAIQHQSAVEMAFWAREAFSAAELCGVLASTAVTFDLSIFEIFVPLAWGGTVVLAENALELPAVAAALPAGVEITLVNTVPSAMAELLREGGLPASVRTLNLAGEALLRWLADQAYARPGTERLCNLYGPSEDTTYSTWAVVERSAERPPSIGRPVHGTRAYVLDAALERLPVGIPGELYLAGVGLARGYLGRPELTAERFLPDPFAGIGGRMYRTGDRVRLRPDGELEYLGRLDHQVKVRGYRIELGEVEAALAAQPNVESAVVLAREDVPGERRLVAYVVAPGAEFEAAELRNALQQTLPEPYIPAAFVFLEALPLTPHGKVDRRALPAPDGSRQGTGVEFVAPRNSVEVALAAVWTEVLRREGIGIHDNFFELGGDSIRTIQVVARSRQRGIRISPRQLFQHQTIAGLAAVTEADSPLAAPVAGGLPLTSASPFSSLDPTELDAILAELGQRSSMTRLDVEDVYPLSPGQQGMLMVVLLSGETEVYFDRSVVTLAGDLDAALWRQAWQRVVDRHPALRTFFVWERREQPLQVVRRQAELPWEMLDWRDLPAAGREARLEDFLRRDSDRRFDLRNPPLMRFSMIRWDQETWKMIWSFHHLIVDGWSLSRIFGEAVTSYAAFRDGREPDLEPPCHYRDYIAWLQRQDLGRAEAFWRGALAGFDEPTPLPYGGNGPGGEVWSYRHEMSWLPPAEIEVLSTLARRNQLTLNTVFQGAWGALLARATGRDDVIFGSVVSGRPGEVEGIESMVGFFINVLPVRLTAGNDAVAAALANLQSRQFEQRDFEYCPLESIQAWSSLPRGSRLIESLLVFQNFPLNPLAVASLPGFRIVDIESKGATHYPITLYVAPRAGGFDLRLDYHESHLEACAARRLLAHLRTLLAGFATRPAARMAELPMITAEERRELLAGAEGPPAEPAHLCIHTLVEEQAARTPDATAVEAGGRILTYRELEARAERLARRLRRLGVGPESIAGLCVERSPEMVVGMLGVLKAGGIYLPLDPVYPRERLAFMLEDSGARVLLTQESLAGSLPVGDREVVLLDAADPAGDDGEPGGPDAQPVPGNGAYLIYTSGSTGRPKGVLVPHAALVSYVAGAGADAGIGAGDRVLQFASMSFDTSAEEIYPCLARGATLVLRDDALAGAPESFLREVERLGLTVLDLPTAYWHELVDGMAAQDLDWPACARLVILGGEQARADRLDVWRRRVGERSRLLNTYGPTEATIVTTRRELKRPRDFPAAVPIGRPVSGARVHVVSRDLELLPAGLDGELVIGGTGLARGYLGRPGLTAERFVPDPFAGSAGERLYRTGDLARWLAAGELEFRGRVDHQVKVRGYRIELGEVEAALRAVPAVRDAAAVAREAPGGGKQLVAFVVPREGSAPTAGDLRVELQGRLPEFMVPSVFAFLPELPLTPSGKIDRRALERIEAGAGQPDSGADYAAPCNLVEEILAAVWAEVLRLDRVGIHDNFLELGGDSILMIQAATRSRQRGVQFTPREMFQNQTVSQLAAVADASGLRAATVDDLLLAEGPSQEMLDSVLAELSEEKGFR
jgi:amino acid adenylation domain-containing protein